MVTGSHNPKDYNGFKFVLRNLPFYGSDLKEFAINTQYKSGDYVFYQSKMYVAQRIFTSSKTPSDDPINWAVLKAPKGEPGRDGTNGKDGANGKDGLQGQPGKDGARGEPGRDGKQGQQGPQGQPGEKGNDGVGLHLRTFQTGFKYNRGDYVFYNSKMYI